MSGYIASLCILALVLSPLFIPIAVTVVQWIRDLGARPHAAKPAVGTPRRTPQPKALRLVDPA